MRTRIDFIAGRIGDAVETVGGYVTLCWKEPAGAPLTRDTVDGAPNVPMVDKQLVVKAMLYYVSATTQIRQFAEIQAGDCIATFNPGLALQGKESLRFVIDGQEWSSKPVSEQLSSYWGVAANLKLYQVVLLRKAT
ncbi:MAG: hypothetical protein KGL39_36765 [Patescibacteria group bacterium]|nr:hypothetical protein [Patescibacteria group bacterium]